MATYEDAVIRVGNKGTIIDVTMYTVSADGNTQTVLDLSAGNSYQLEFKRKDSTTQVVTATIKNAPGSNGVLTYTDTGGAVFAHTKAKRGRWEVRGIINYASGNTFKGSWEGFTVGE
jgi:hypothetical protein